MEFSYYDFGKGDTISSKNGVIIHNLRLLEKLESVKKLLWVMYKINVDFELVSKTISTHIYEYSPQTLLHEGFQPIIRIPKDNPIKMYEANRYLKKFLRYVSVYYIGLNDGITASTSFFYDDNDIIIPHKIVDITNEMLLLAKKSAIQLELHTLGFVNPIKKENKKWYQFW